MGQLTKCQGSETKSMPTRGVILGKRLPIKYRPQSCFPPIPEHNIGTRAAVGINPVIACEMRRSPSGYGLFWQYCVDGKLEKPRNRAQPYVD